MSHGHKYAKTLGFQLTGCAKADTAHTGHPDRWRCCNIKFETAPNSLGVILTSRITSSSGTDHAGRFGRVFANTLRSQLFHL